jgi:hypothetical protein
MRIPIYFRIIPLFLLGACSQYQVIHVDESTTIESKEGYYYSLPRNVVTIDINVKQITKISGPYAAFASKYLGIKDAPQSNSTNFELNDIKINTYAEPDPSHYYFVDLSKCRSKKGQAMMMSLSEASLIQDVNDNSDQQIQKEREEKKEKNDIDYSETFKYFAETNLIEKIDTIVEEVTFDTATIERTLLKRSLVEKTIEQKAQEAANLLSKIKVQRLDIITGAQEVAYSDATVKYMSDQLAAMEEEIMQLFMGITQTEVFQYRYYYLPESEVYSASIPLFKFSKSEGIVKENNSQGEMVYIHIDRARNTTQLEKFIEKQKEIDQSEDGLFYRIPEYAKFTIKEGETLKAEASFLISQFGVITSLPARQVKVQFYPNTGAIRKVQIH